MKVTCKVLFPWTPLTPKTVLFFSKSAQWWRRHCIGGPRQLCSRVCRKGFVFWFFFFSSHSLPPHPETPPPPRGKFLNKASPVARGRAVSIPFPALIYGSVRGEEIQKLDDEKGGGRGSREGAALEEGPGTPSEPQMFSSWPWGAAPQPRAFRRLCVRVSEEGITQREQPRQRGRWATVAVKRRLAFFVDF